MSLTQSIALLFIIMVGTFTIGWCNDIWPGKGVYNNNSGVLGRPFSNEPWKRAFHSLKIN